MMIHRRLSRIVKEALGRQAVVVLIGPRQVGKTTLAYQFVKKRDALYLDLESQRDRSKIATDPALFLGHYENCLVVLDEIHRVPEIFQELRGLVDRGRRQGKRYGRFLILGSASMDLMKQSGESLAGRVEYLELCPFNVLELPLKSIQDLWMRGGFPGSFLADSDKNSFIFRENFIRTYLERDMPQLVGRLLPKILERLWVMLAHSQGTLLNASKLASALSLTQPTVKSYIDLLENLMLVRRLPPFFKNTKKRLVKTPKIYIRDSGLLHTLLHIRNYNELMGHPILGMSWEGFVIEQILSVIPVGTKVSFYGTATGVEVDLILELPGRKLWAIEIKYSLSALPGKGFYSACQEIKPTHSFIVHAGKETYPIKAKVEAIALPTLLKRLIAL